MFTNYTRERQIKNALRAIARQRVALVLPGDFPVIENAAPDTEWFDVAARTCLIRGWVEVLHHGVPTGKLEFQGSEPIFPQEMTAKPMYRLTEGGWSAMNRSHAWVIATFLVALVTLAATVYGVWYQK